MSLVEGRILTQLHKVVVLQNLLRPVLQMEQVSTAPPHRELFPSILELLGQAVAPQGLGPQGPDRGRGAPTGQPEPLSPDTHRHTGHCCTGIIQGFCSRVGDVATFYI